MLFIITLYVYIYRPVALEVDIDLVLTEVFKTLRMIKPMIQFFVSDDDIGVLDHFNWLKPLRSASWLFIFTIVYGYFPQYAWPLSLVTAGLVFILFLFWFLFLLCILHV